MATAKGQVTLRGRFRPGTEVRLVKVRDEAVLRSEGGKEVATATVDESGTVQFKSGVQVGGRYFVVGQVEGGPLEVRARGRAADDPGEVLSQAPVTADRTRLADGTFVDEAPEREKAGFGGVGPAPGQHQAPEGTVQRSDTPRGSAHPHDPEEQAPYPRQEDVPDTVAQRSDTPTGMATPIVHDAPVAQGDVKAGTWQRSDTPAGVATPIPKGDAIAAQEMRESADTKAGVGEPVKAAAAPPEVARTAASKLPAGKSTADEDDTPPPSVTPTPPGQDGPVEDQSGRDPQGQPLAADVAAAAGVTPASSPTEPVKRTARKTASGSSKRSGSSSRSGGSRGGKSSATSKKSSGRKSGSS